MSALRKGFTGGAVLALTAAVVFYAGPAHAAGLTATFSKADWGSGYEGKYTITNGTTASVTWRLEFDLSAGSTISSFWDANLTVTGTHVVATGRWNATLAPGGSAIFGWVGAPGTAVPANCTINGGPCDGSVDSTAPTVPANLRSTGATALAVALAWNASTDSGGSGLAGYNIYRGGAGPQNPAAQTVGPATAFTDAGRTANKTYTYVVRARDGAGNLSGPSNQISVTTPPSDDTTPPSAPTNLTNPAKSSTTVTLAWGASTDGGSSGLAGYNIYRDSSGPQNPIAQTTNTATTFTDVGRQPNTTHSYVVRARDGAGNLSGPSNQISVRTDPPTNPATLRKVAYYTQWSVYSSGRNFQLQDVDQLAQAGKLTHVHYAFANVNEQGRCFEANQTGVGDAWADYQSRLPAEASVDGVGDVFNQPLAGNFNQIKKLKAKHPHLKVLMSLGGWTWSKFFSNAALPQNRAAFVASCIDLFIKGNLPVMGGEPQGGAGVAFGVFDGFDLDWEWPGSEGNVGNIIRPEDRQNFTALLQEFRTQLDAYGDQVGREYLLAAFLPADPAKIAAGFQPQIFNHVDYATVQGYDFYGAWEPQTNNQSQILSPTANPAPRRFSIEIAVDAWLAQQAPLNKLVIGFPAYGRGWTGVPNVNDGLYQNGGAAPGRFEAGIDDYKLVKTKPGAIFRDSANGAIWKYDGSNFWSYDDAQLVQQKAAYVKDRGLGGMMMWSLDGDDGTLVNAMHVGLQ